MTACGRHGACLDGTLAAAAVPTGRGEDATERRAVSGLRRRTARLGCSLEPEPSYQVLTR